MKNSKIKIAAGLLCTLILFACSSALILSCSIPDTAMITEGEKNGQWLPDGYRWLCRTDETPSNEVWQNSSDAIETGGGEKLNATVYFCGIIPVKNVEIAVVEGMSVVPGGEAVGISLQPDGVLVAGTADVDTSSGKQSPAKDAGLMPGDIIQKIDGNAVTLARQVLSYVENASDALTVEGIRGEKNTVWSVMPVSSTDGDKKIGLWVRDTVSGIGTLSFYCDGKFGALGHPISDIDTGRFVKAAGGNIYHASIVGVDKGQKGAPGSLSGIFTGNKLGEINKNSDFGVFGTAPQPDAERVAVAKKNEVKCTKAELRCDIGEGVEKFEIEIVRVMPSADSTKGMVIHITDQRLLEKTGGIVQGMSGSPIIQNGRIVGAVTHVFVNDPTRGYGIFAETMLGEMEKIGKN